MKTSLKFIFLFQIVLFGCKNDTTKTNRARKASVDTLVSTINTIVSFNVFIENSGSMDGYISQPSEFKDVIRSFTSDIPTYFNTNPGFFFVNSNGTCEALPKNSTPDYSKFITDLSPANSKLKFSPGSNSSIDNIIDFCTKDMKDKVSIIFSDCILSYKGTKEDGAKSAQANIKMFMSKKIKTENLSTIVIKFNSKFQGKYYNESNGGKAIQIPTVINRPFYALVFGESKTLNYLLSKVNFKKYSGYESSYTLLSNNKNNSPNSIITYENKIGSFEFVKPASEMKIVKAETKKGSSDFQFSINANLNEMPFENDYLTNVNHYSVNENFKVKSIEKSDNANGYSHLLTFYTNDLKQVSNLTVGINYAIPKWIDLTGSDVDDNPMDSTQQKQTFGFKYLMMGVSEAYIANNDSLQFKIPISINKSGSGNGSSSKFPWWIFIVIIAVLGLLIYLKNKK